jgi:hypothetical protein
LPPGRLDDPIPASGGGDAVIRKMLFGGAVLGSLFWIGTASAQTALQTSPQVYYDEMPTCWDVCRRSDGSWIVLRPISVGGQQLNKGYTFRSGQIFGAQNFGAEIEKKCREVPHEETGCHRSFAK